MKKITKKILKSFISACREAAARGLSRCSSGNMSWRIDDNLMLATATRSWMERLTAADVVLCDISRGKALDGKKPTAEIAFHAAILRSRPDINVVLHFQSPFATALACRRARVKNFFVIPEISFYIGPVSWVPCLTPGTRELAAAVTKAMLKHDLVIMANHGQVTVAADFDHAIQNAEFFELACEIIVRNGGNPRPMAGKTVKDLLALRNDLKSTAARGV
jgi:ribulose-5-phosphate 4-epimerase/fuculose-1-phosphate aldolase